MPKNTGIVFKNLKLITVPLKQLREKKTFPRPKVKLLEVKLIKKKSFVMFGLCSY